MYDFEIKIPTEIYFGSDVLDEVGRLMSKYGHVILLVYGSERIFDNGLGQKIIENLNCAGCRVILCGGVKPNADTKYIDSAIELGRKEGIDGILAIGGGSVMDSAKAVSAGFYGKKDIWSLYNKREQPETFLPIGAVVTVPGTASESNGTSVISNFGTHEKVMGFFDKTKPKFALLDPKLTLTVSPYQTAVSGFDVFAHAFERFFDLSRESLLLDSLTAGLMRTVVKILPSLVEDGNNVNLRSELMIAATYAHNDMLGPGGDFTCHEISHTVTEKTGIPHGATLAMIIPSWCAYMAEKNPHRFLDFYSQVFRAQTLEEGILELRRFIEAIGLSTDFEGDDSLPREIAKEVAKVDGHIGGGFCKMTEQDIEKVCLGFTKGVV